MIRINQRGINIWLLSLNFDSRASVITCVRYLELATHHRKLSVKLESENDYSENR